MKRKWIFFLCVMGLWGVSGWGCDPAPLPGETATEKFVVADGQGESVSKEAPIGQESVVPDGDRQEQTIPDNRATPEVTQESLLPDPVGEGVPEPVSEQPPDASEGQPEPPRPDLTEPPPEQPATPEQAMCSGGTQLCAGACVDLSSSAAHCGACAQACSAGTTCEKGQCICPTGQMLCGGSCVNLNTDAMHCGACSTVCSSGDVCQSGQCQRNCVAPTATLCGASCVNTSTDRQHCGACNAACPAAQSCQSGACVCPSGQMLCGSSCVNTATHLQHCGVCSNSCAVGQSCQSGQCQCPSGQTLCGSNCVNTSISAQHCGGCNRACPSGQSCQNASCACPSGQALCAGQCVNTSTSSQHCGGCNAACPTGQSCQGGRCVCPTGQVLCAGSCVNTSTSAQHCGGCNAACPSGQSCQSGQCQCTPGQPGCQQSALDDEFTGTALSGWQILNPTSAALSVSGGSLHIVPNQSVWYNASTAISVWKSITGNFTMTSYVTTRRTSNPNLPPTPQYRLGGMMARNPSTANGQNYVFIVVGADLNDVSVETKTTVNSVSTFTGPSWPSGEGELRICRIGSAFRHYIRSRNGVWQLQATFTRADLPNTLQVGPVAYANTNPPDLRVSFEYVRFGTANTLTDCTQ